MGPTYVWGPHEPRGGAAAHMGQPHQNPRPMRQGPNGRPPQTITLGLAWRPSHPSHAGPRGGAAPHLASYIRRVRVGGAAPQVSPRAAAPLPPPPLPQTLRRSPVGSPPYPPPHRRCAADLASLSTTSCGIKNVESSSSRTCGYPGGVARTTHRIIHLTSRRV